MISCDLALHDNYRRLHSCIFLILLPRMADETPPSPPDAKPVLPREFRPKPVKLLAAAGHAVRWALLRELASASALSVNELARRTGTNANLISKHLAVLREAGAIVVRDDVPGDARRQMYAVPEIFRAQAAVPVLDYGVCVLRFD